MHRTLILHGFILILLSLLGAFFIPAMALPRLGLSAHTIGMIAGVLLIAVGSIWPALALAPRLRAALVVAWCAAGYLNWLGCMVGAVSGAGRATPISSGGVTGPAWAEGLSGGLLLLSAASALLAVALSIYGLAGGRGGRGGEP
jgi:hydroxylaminobenzene mutase